MSKATDRAYQQIRSDILSGALAPGDPLREEQLAEACGVSRTPVREALRRLETEQLIRRTDSQRSFVAEWSLDDIEEGFQLRAMLESHAAARAAQRIQPQQLAQLEQYNVEIADAVRREAPDIASFARINRQFHDIIISAANSERLARLLSGVIEQPIVLRTAERYDRAQLERSISEHQELISAFRKGDSAWAAGVMGAHIRRAFHAYNEAFEDYLRNADRPAR